MVETQFQGSHVEAAITLRTKYLIAGTVVRRGGTINEMSDDALDIMSPDYKVGIPADLPNITTHSSLLRFVSASNANMFFPVSSLACSFISNFGGLTSLPYLVTVTGASVSLSHWSEILLCVPFL